MVVAGGGASIARPPSKAGGAGAGGAAGLAGRGAGPSAPANVAESPGAAGPSWDSETGAASTAFRGGRALEVHPIRARNDSVIQPRRMQVQRTPAAGK